VADALLDSDALRLSDSQSVWLCSLTTAGHLTASQDAATLEDQKSDNALDKLRHTGGKINRYSCPSKESKTKIDRPHCGDWSLVRRGTRH